MKTICYMINQNSTIAWPAKSVYTMFLISQTICFKIIIVLFLFLFVCWLACVLPFLFPKSVDHFEMANKHAQFQCRVQFTTNFINDLNFDTAFRSVVCSFEEPEKMLNENNKKQKKLYYIFFFVFFVIF